MTTLNNEQLRRAMVDLGMEDFTSHRIKRTVVSVPHSGTRWARRTFESLSVHTYVDDEIEGVVICPLRDPKDIWASWCRRGGTGHAVLVNFDHAWRELVRLDGIHDIHYMPLDTPDRDVHFDRICKVLGEDITPEWDQRDGHLDYEDKPYDKDLSWIYELPMIKRFYEQAL